MECPRCYYKFDGFSKVCEKCGYEFQDEDSLLIGEYIDKYNHCTFEQIKFPNDSSVFFKNIKIKNIDDGKSAEQIVIDYYKEHGYNAFFAENRYWLLLFLLFYFKDVIMDSYISVELDYATNTYSDNYIPRLNTMDFNSINCIPNLKEFVIENYFKCLDLFNDGKKMFIEGDSKYKLFSIDELLSAVCFLNIEQLILIFERMGSDFEYYTSGLPDLIVYNDTNFFFAEVKSKEDKPSFRQIQWHKYLVDTVNVDVVIFTINKTGNQIDNIKKMYDVELVSSKDWQPPQNNPIEWDSLQLDSSKVDISELRQLFIFGQYRPFNSFMTDKYTRLNKNTFDDITIWEEYRNGVFKKNAEAIYKKAVEIYSVDTFVDYGPTKIQLSRNKQAKLLEKEGNYNEAIKLYLKNVNEKTASPTTYIGLIKIYRKFRKYDELVKLLDIAIPIFISRNEKKNALYFLFYRINKLTLTGTNYKMLELIDNKELTSPSNKKDKQTDLSIYFK